MLLLACFGSAILAERWWGLERKRTLLPKRTFAASCDQKVLIEGGRKVSRLRYG